MARLKEGALGEATYLSALRIGSVVALLAAWQLTAMTHVFSDFLLPPLSTVLLRLWQDLLSGELINGIALTLVRTFIGFALATAVGVAVGVAIARVPLARWFFDPLVSAGLPMPKIAFLPIFMLWFGVFNESKILMIAFSSVFPVIVEAWAGTQNIDKYMSWSAMSLGVGRHRFLWEIALPAALPQVFTGLQVALPISLIVASLPCLCRLSILASSARARHRFLWEIALPAALPQVFTGLQVALPISLIVAIVCEMQMGGVGLGGSIMTDMRFADSPGVFSGIIAIAVVGMILVKAMELLRRRLLVWHQETQGA